MPLFGSQNTMSPGVMVMPEMVIGTLTACGLLSAPAPTVEVPLAKICVKDCGQLGSGEIAD